VQRDTRDILLFHGRVGVSLAPSPTLQFVFPLKAFWGRIVSLTEIRACAGGGHSWQCAGQRPGAAGPVPQGRCRELGEAPGPRHACAWDGLDKQSVFMERSKIIPVFQNLLGLVFPPPQVPEQDQTYAEDSFCVGEEEEETCKKSESSEEEVCVNFDLLNNESFTSGRKQYLTRRRKKLNQARMEENCSVPVQKKKPSRIIVLSDSSGEETSVSSEKPMKTDCCWAEQEHAKLPKSLPSASSAQHKKMAGEIGGPQSAESKSEMLLGLEASVSDLLDFHPERRVRSTCVPPAVTAADPGREGLQAPAEVGVSSKRGPSSPLTFC